MNILVNIKQIYGGESSHSSQTADWGKEYQSGKISLSSNWENDMRALPRIGSTDQTFSEHY